MFITNPTFLFLNLPALKGGVSALYLRPERRSFTAHLIKNQKCEALRKASQRLPSF